jgi:hypothetical protein
MKTSAEPKKRPQDRRAFLEHLASVGWQVEGWEELHDFGANVDPVAEAHYAGVNLEIHIEFHEQDGYLGFELDKHHGDVLLRLRLHRTGDLIPLLSQIIAAQDILDEDNFPGMVKQFIPLCDPVLIETTDGLFKLVLD